MGDIISDAEFNAVVDGLLSRYAGALDQMAKGVMPHESDIGPATEAIRKELTTLRAKLSAAEAQLAECYRLSGADPDGNEDWRLAGDAVAEVGRLRQEHDAAEAQGEAMRGALGEIGDLDSYPGHTIDLVKTIGRMRAIARRALEGAKE